MRRITLNKIIDFILFIYILSLYFLTQQQGLNLISNAIALIFIVSIWLDVVLKKKKIQINYFLFIYLIFIFMCIFSILYSVNYTNALTKSRTLILNFILIFSLINYLDSTKKIKKLLFFFINSGFLASLYLIITTDFSRITRIGNILGNENAIGIILTLSTTISFYFILEDKNYKLVPLLLINIVSILLTGSRQALLFLVISIVSILFLISKGSIVKKIRYLVISVFTIFFVLYAIFNIPIFYDIIGSRIDNVLGILVGQGTTEGSLNIRSYMVEFGINKFKERPLLGYGIDNYRFLLNENTGMYTYAHNNIIELLVSVGLIGTYFYYYAQFILVKNLFKKSRYHKDKSDYKLSYLLIAIIFSYTVLSISTVYYDNKIYNIVLAISSALPYVYSKEKMSLREDFSNSYSLSHE